MSSSFSKLKSAVTWFRRSPHLFLRKTRGTGFKNEEGWCALKQALEDVGFEVIKKRERGLLAGSVAIRYRS